jgi:hypothetical protein
VRNCKVKTTGIALSVDASVPPASAARGMGVHALSNHGRARAQGRDAARECRAFKAIRARSVLNRAATGALPKTLIFGQATPGRFVNTGLCV